MHFWNNIYSNFDPVALSFGSFSIHWYGIMYVLALFGALFIGKWIVKKDNLNFTDSELENYFVWVEIGVILGARVGYVLFYDPNWLYYISSPWQIFNPFFNGEFVGISGMSFHGGLIGFLVANFWYCARRKKNPWAYLDLVALSVPLAYVFGRIGNFLNQELIGRDTDVAWGIYVDGVLKHPSQLYEAFLEGVVVFVLLYMYRSKKRFDGELIALYGFLYSLTRFIAEFYRAPDIQIGFIFESLTLGQILCALTMVVSLFLYLFLSKRKSA